MIDCPSCGNSTSRDYTFCPSCGVALRFPARGPREPHAARPGPASEAGPPSDAPPHRIAEPSPGGAGFAAPPTAEWMTEPGPGRGPGGVPLAERRLVSVLFLDLVGFTTLSERLDPEDVREIQSRYFEAARASVAHYGGSLEKFIGDAVMAVWGSPVAHEDDGERALRAALEIVAAVATIATPVGAGHLTARGAVATGEAAVTLNAQGQGMVTGDLVNTASRLQDAADPGTVLVDAATRSVVGLAADLEPAGELTLKGRSAPVAAWRATAIAAHPGSEARVGHRGPFVGRDAELRAVLGQRQAVLDEGRLRVVSLLGIAGIGKSRLAWEVQEHGPGGADVRWLAGRAPGYGEGIAFAPLAEMVRRAAAIADGDPAEVARRSLHETLAHLVEDDDERRWIEPRLLTLLEPGTIAAADREELFAAWRRFLEALAEEEPLVLLFEDLQWADGGLLDFIGYLADWARHSAILVLTLARPELLDARPSWGAGLPLFTAIHLEPLSDAAIDELLAALAPGLPASLAAAIRARADGVPLYAVEMARMLVERTRDGGGARIDAAAEPAAAAPAAAGPRAAGGAAAASADELGVHIPESLHALIAARIDALPQPERNLLLTAAVLGRRFRPEALAAVSGTDPRELREQLRALLRREFLSMDDDPRSPGRGQLAFVQELVREVAYNTISRRQRRVRHLAVVAFLEASGDPDLAEPIAEHLLAAHAATSPGQDDAGQIAVRARTALRSAADRAHALHAPARALAHLERALDLTDDPPIRAELAASAGMAARAAARFGTAEEHLRRAIELRSNLGDPVAASRHRAQLASLLLQAQRSDTALGELEEAWQAIEAEGHGPGGRPGAGEAEGLEVLAELARAHLLRGDPARAVEWAERAIADAGETAPAGGGATAATAIDARITLGTARAGLGEVDRGMTELRKAIADAQAAGFGSAELRAVNNLAWLTVTDDPRATSEMARHGLELADRLGNREMSLQLLDVAGIVAIELGAWPWALNALEEASGADLPTSYRLDFAATRSIIGALMGTPSADAPIGALGATEADLDPEAVGWVEHARAVAAWLAGDLPGALEIARRSAPQMIGYERAAALALAVRVAAWAGDEAAAADALDRLERNAGQGRAAEASRTTARAAVASLRGDADAATSGWEAAVAHYDELALPLPRALAHLDRWILAGSEPDREAATAGLTSLGADGLLAAARRARPERGG